MENHSLCTHSALLVFPWKYPLTSGYQPREPCAAGCCNTRGAYRALKIIKSRQFSRDSSEDAQSYSLLTPPCAGVSASCGNDFIVSPCDFSDTLPSAPVRRASNVPFTI